MRAHRTPPSPVKAGLHSRPLSSNSILDSAGVWADRFHTIWIETQIRTRWTGKAASSSSPAAPPQLPFLRPHPGWLSSRIADGAYKIEGEGGLRTYFCPPPCASLGAVLQRVDPAAAAECDLTLSCAALRPEPERANQRQGQCRPAPLPLACWNTRDVRMGRFLSPTLIGDPLGVLCMRVTHTPHRGE